MVDIGFLKELPWYDDSPWASPTFGILKKTGDIRIITDFRELNKWAKVDPYSLSRINETLQKLDQFKSATALDLSLGFIQFHLTKQARNCTVQSYHGVNTNTCVCQWVSVVLRQ